jgi:transcriptional regulator with XRE-family HTH domain
VYYKKNGAYFGEKNMPYDNLGARIKQYLDDNGRFYSLVANRLGREKTSFWKLLNGFREIKASDFLSICDILEVDPRYLATYPIKEDDLVIYEDNVAN